MQLNQLFVIHNIWIERFISAAGLEVLQLIGGKKSRKATATKYLKLRNYWNKNVAKNNLSAQVPEISALSVFNYIYVSNLISKAYLAQKMLKTRILDSDSIYFSLAHSSKYIEKLQEIFIEVSKFESSSYLKEFLNGPTCHSKFKRLK